MVRVGCPAPLFPLPELPGAPASIGATQPLGSSQHQASMHMSPGFWPPLHARLA
jgi:hypothetical protein